jgi:two-component system response regulator (stage 0 sporulation protein A)
MCYFIFWKKENHRGAYGMEMKRLLVADTSLSFCSGLIEALDGAYEVRVCHDGLQTKDQITSFAPDVLVVELALPGMDGIALLHELAKPGKRPLVLVTTWIVSPYIESTLRGLPIDYLMLKPCSSRILAERIHDMTNCRVDTLTLPTSADTVSNMLRSLHFSPKLGGFRYLEEGIVLYEQNPTQSVTKVLYPEIAKRCNCSAESVERAIRTAIHTAWLNGDTQVWSRYFRTDQNGMVPRPTNTAFISAMAECLHRHSRIQRIG